jgi:hypothetical protein
VLRVAKGLPLLAKKGLPPKAGAQVPAKPGAEGLLHFELQARNERQSKSFARASDKLSSEQYAQWEAAIQLNLVTVREAETLIAQHKTVRTWMAEKTVSAVDGHDVHSHKSIDKLLVLSLLLFNLLVLVGVAMAIAWLSEDYL